MCREQRASGTLLLESWGRSARISWQMGEITDAIAGRLSGDAALDEVRTMRDGRFTLRTSEPISLHATAPTPTVLEPTAIPAPAMRVESRRPAPAPVRCAAPRPAPPPIPAHALGHRPAAHRPAAMMPQPYAYAAPNGVPAGSLVPRLRLPSTALSVGIFCVTMLVSLMAVIQL